MLWHSELSMRPLLSTDFANSTFIRCSLLAPDVHQPRLALPRHRGRQHRLPRHELHEQAQLQLRPHYVREKQLLLLHLQPELLEPEGLRLAPAAQDQSVVALPETQVVPAALALVEGPGAARGPAVLQLDLEGLVEPRPGTADGNRLERQVLVLAGQFFEPDSDDFALGVLHVLAQPGHPRDHALDLGDALLAELLHLPQLLDPASHVLQLLRLQELPAGLLLQGDVLPAPAPVAAASHQLYSSLPNNYWQSYFPFTPSHSATPPSSRFSCSCDPVNIKASQAKKLSLLRMTCRSPSSRLLFLTHSLSEFSRVLALPSQSLHWLRVFLNSLQRSSETSYSFDWERASCRTWTPLCTKSSRASFQFSTYRNMPPTSLLRVESETNSLKLFCTCWASGEMNSARRLARMSSFDFFLVEATCSQRLSNSPVNFEEYRLESKVCSLGRLPSSGNSLAIGLSTDRLSSTKSSVQCISFRRAMCPQDCPGWRSRSWTRGCSFFISSFLCLVVEQSTAVRKTRMPSRSLRSPSGYSAIWSRTLTRSLSTSSGSTSWSTTLTSALSKKPSSRARRLMFSRASTGSWCSAALSCVIWEELPRPRQRSTIETPPLNCTSRPRFSSTASNIQFRFSWASFLIANTPYLDFTHSSKLPPISWKIRLRRGSSPHFSSSCTTREPCFLRTYEFTKGLIRLKRVSARAALSSGGMASMSPRLGSCSSRLPACCPV